MNRKKPSDPAFEIRFYEKILARDPTQVDVLRQLGHLYTRAGRVREGLRADLLLSYLCPRDAVAQYNLACSYALLSDLDKAFACLEEAVRLGYRDLGHIDADPDLALLRCDPRYPAFKARAAAADGTPAS